DRRQQGFRGARGARLRRRGGPAQPRAQRCQRSVPGGKVRRRGDRRADREDVAGHPVLRGAPRAARGEDSRTGGAGGSQMNESLLEVDPEVAMAIAAETRRQNETIELIASENFVSEAVLEATGSVFTNKYAEGYPGKRYYGGCEFVDVVENLAR